MMGGTHGWIVEGGVAITVYEIGCQVETGRQRRSAAAAAVKLFMVGLLLVGGRQNWEGNRMGFEL